MASKAEIALAFSPGTTNVAWVSLPYNHTMRRATDIASALTDARADLVGRWDPANQKPVLWYRFRGQWRGEGFAVHPYDGDPPGGFGPPTLAALWADPAGRPAFPPPPR